VLATCGRAEEILTKAETMTDEGARETMRYVAARYEKLAERLEEEAEDAQRPAPGHPSSRRLE